MYRLYYWIEGAPENRPLGPWWVKDFVSEGEREAYLNALRPLLKSAYFVQGEPEELPDIYYAPIYPPNGAVKVHGAL